VKHESNRAAEPWVTLQEALSILGKSDASLRRLVARGKVHRTTRPRDGRSPEPMYSRDDLERLNVVDAFPVPEAGANGKPSADAGQQLAARPATPPSFTAFAEFALALAAARTPAEPPPPQPAAWLTLEQASAHCGLSAQLLRRLILREHLPAIKDGKDWKVRRYELDAMETPAKDHASRATADSVARKKRAKT